MGYKKRTRAPKFDLSKIKSIDTGDGGSWSTYLMRMRNDDLPFRLYKGDVLLVHYFRWDTSKLTVVCRVRDGYDPRCNVYKNQVEEIDA